MMIDRTIEPRPSPMRYVLRIAGVFAALVLETSSLSSQTPAELQKLQDEAVQRAKEYLRINTANPPGSEFASMKWFARMLKDEGITFDTDTTAPVRGTIWTRLNGETEPALLRLD